MMKHTEDGEDLAIFAKGDEIAIACRGGHVWTIKTEQLEIKLQARGRAEEILELFPEVTAFSRNS